MANPLDGLLPIRNILIDGEETPFLRDLDFASSSFQLTVDEASGRLSIAIASSYEPDEVQGANILIGTEPGNVSTTIGNAASSAVTIDGAELTLRANSILVDTDNDASFSVSGISGKVFIQSTDNLSFDSPEISLGENSDSGTVKIGAGIGNGSFLEIAVQQVDLLADDIFNIGNGTDVSVEIGWAPNRMNVSTTDTIAIAAASIKLGGTADSDKISIAGNGSIVTADLQAGTIFNVRAASFGIYEAGQALSSFVFVPDADGACALNIGSGATSFKIDMPASAPLSLYADTLVIGRAAADESNLTITPNVADLYSRVSASRGLRFAAVGSDGISFENSHASGNVSFQPGASGIINLQGTVRVAGTVKAPPGSGAAGSNLTIGGGPGGTPGTHLGGNTIIDLHQVVSNVSAELRINADTTQLITIKQTSSGISALDFGAAGGTTGGLIRGSTVNMECTTHINTQTATNGTLYQIGGTQIRRLTSSTSGYRIEDASGNIYEHVRIGTATATTATTTYPITFGTTANRVYKCKAHITVGNATDSQGASYEVECTFKNVSGTITAVDGSATVVKQRRDAGQTGLSPALTFVSTNILVGLTTDSTDTVNIRCVLYVEESVLA